MKCSSLHGSVLLCLFTFLACGRDNAVEPDDQDKIVSVSFSVSQGTSSVPLRQFAVRSEALEKALPLNSALKAEVILRPDVVGVHATTTETAGRFHLFVYGVRKDTVFHDSFLFLTEVDAGKQKSIYELPSNFSSPFGSHSGIPATLYVFLIDGIGDRPSENIQLTFYGVETETFTIDPKNYLLPNSNVLHLTGSSLNWPRIEGDLVFNVNKHAELSLVPMYVFRAELSVYQANCTRMFDQLNWTAGEGFLEHHFCGLPKIENYEFYLFLLDRG